MVRKAKRYWGEELIFDHPTFFVCFVLLSPFLAFHFHFPQSLLCLTPFLAKSSPQNILLPFSSTLVLFNVSSLL